jgi:hypothetical protein
MNSSNLPLLQPFNRYRPIRTRRTRSRFPEIIDNNSNNSNTTYYSNTYNNNNNPNNFYDNINDTSRCPVCNEELNIFELFTHIFLNHEQFLAVWTSLSFPSINPDDTNSITHLLRNLGISNDILNNHFDDEFDQLSYEQLTALCDEIGYHKIGIKNIDNVAPAIVRMKKGTDEERCPICLEDMHKALYMRIIKECQHEFCGECIEKWFKENKNCPICKLEINDENNIDTQISSISESSNGGNDTLRLSPTPTPESSSESLANTTFDVSSSV